MVFALNDAQYFGMLSSSRTLGSILALSVGSVLLADG